MRMAVLMMVFMAVGMIPVCVRFAHNPFTTLAAAQAAPYPLSIFMIPTPGAQLESILASAARPPCAAPYPTDVGTPKIGLGVSPPITLTSAASSPATTITGMIVIPCADLGGNPGEHVRGKPCEQDRMPRAPAKTGEQLHERLERLPFAKHRFRQPDPGRPGVIKQNAVIHILTRLLENSETPRRRGEGRGEPRPTGAGSHAPGRIRIMAARERRLTP